MFRLLIMLGLSVFLASAAIVSTFDTNAEGWTVTGYDLAALPVPGVTHQSPGGNPGGYITTSDPGDPVPFFTAPAAFHGNLSAYINGTLFFDIRTPQAVGAETSIREVVRLHGNGLILSFNLTVPASTWTSKNVPLIASAGWRIDDSTWANHTSGAAASQAQLLSALSNVTQLQILADWIGGANDITDLDNVSFARGEAVPEPSTVLPLCGALLLGVGLLRKKARKLS